MPLWGVVRHPDFYYDFTSNEGSETEAFLWLRYFSSATAECNKNFAIAYNDMRGKEFVWGLLFVYIKILNLSDCYKITSIKGKKNSYNNKMNSISRKWKKLKKSK